MPIISAEEMKRRRESIASNLGTHAMEGMLPDQQTLDLMRRYETGELSLDQFCEAMDRHAHSLIAAGRSLAGVA